MERERKIKLSERLEQARTATVFPNARLTAQGRDDLLHASGCISDIDGTLKRGCVFVKEISSCHVGCL